MPAFTPQVLADPVKVIVDLVTGTDPLLDPTEIQRVAEATAAGRAKRRKLAQALLDKPSLLIDGRSPAPRAVGDLLIALRQAGSTAVSAPVCAECGKQLRTLQRRGEDWYCGGCGPNREPCAGCGNLRPVSSRDRHGDPRCVACPSGELDPGRIVVDIVAQIDPALPADVVASAVIAAAPRTGQRHQLAWALQDRPSLLTGAGAQAPVPSVLRLTDLLCEAGSTTIVRPPCPHCGRMLTLVKPRDGLRLCRNCVAKSRAEPCSRCGAVREAATRDGNGEPLCPHCLSTDPANHETCVGCGRRRPVSVRAADGPLCPACRTEPVLTCAICARSAPCAINKATGQPWCTACRQRWTRCSGCGNVRAVRGGTGAEPLCATCTRPEPDFWRSCPICGQTGQLVAGPCIRCNIDARLRELLDDGTGDIRPELQSLHHNLRHAEKPDTVLAWLAKNSGAAILRQLAAGDRPLTHAALDELPEGKPLKHLRTILVATGALPARDEHMARLEQAITHTISQRRDPDEQHLLRRYAIWHMLRRLRSRLNGAETTSNQFTSLMRHLHGALELLDWLTTRSLTLHTARQGDLDSWLASDNAKHRRELGHFIRWAKAQKLTTLDLPAIRWAGPQQAIDTESRWEHARRLLHDDTIKPEDRVAGLFVLLYAQWPAAISRLTIDHINTNDHTVRLRLGREPVDLPEPLAGLVLHLVATRRGHGRLGDQGTSRWLFPGGEPGRPVSSYQLTERLRHLGIRPGQSRSTALFQLATELPAALLARILGIHISVAVAWQRASAGDWAAYAADVGRRPLPATPPPDALSRELPLAQSKGSRP